MGEWEVSMEGHPPLPWDFPRTRHAQRRVMHAIACSLIFDSLHRAVATTPHDHKTFDQIAAHSAPTGLLADNSTERLCRIAAMALGGKDE
jgi:hypothetical protein